MAIFLFFRGIRGVRGVKGIGKQEAESAAYLSYVRNSAIAERLKKSQSE